MVGAFRGTVRSPLAELFRHAVLEMLVGRERLSPQTREMLLHRRHSGFAADASTGAVRGDREGLYRLTCTLHNTRCAPGRMEYTRGSRQVIYHVNTHVEQWETSC